jgi:putative sigma-54 modulation protein
MQIVTNGKNLDLTPAIKEYVQQKIGRLENHFDFILEVHVILELEKNPRIHANQLAEATIHVNGAVIRVESASENLYASIDLLADKINRVLNKHKTKLNTKTSKTRTHDTIRREGEAEVSIEEGEDEDDEDIIYVHVETEEPVPVAEK